MKYSMMTVLSAILILSLKAHALPEDAGHAEERTDPYLRAGFATKPAQDFTTDTIYSIRGNGGYLTTLEGDVYKVAPNQELIVENMYNFLRSGSACHTEIEVREGRNDVLYKIFNRASSPILQSTAGESSVPARALLYQLSFALPTHTNKKHFVVKSP